MRLESLGFYFDRPKLPEKIRDRAHFGFSPSEHIYACPQELFKIHPDFDGPLGEILRRDPRGVLALIDNGHRDWNEALMRRFRSAFPDRVDRVRFLPRMEKQEFMNLVAISDVLLDPIHSGGGTTTFESLAAGTPLVTWPGEFARGRFTAACYKRMGVMDCVASTLGEYVEIALRLGSEPARNEAVRSSILAANHVLYEDMNAVHEWEDFLENAVREHSQSGGGEPKRR